MLEKITDSVYAHTEGKTIGNVGLIASEKGNFLIDTSMYPKVGRDLRIEVENIKTGKIAAVILTHYHGDHIGGSQHFTDSKIYAHKILKSNLERSLKETWSPENLAKRLEANPDQAHLFEGINIPIPNKIFSDQEIVLEDDSSIKVFFTGGHTSGSSFVLYKPEQTIFAGDNIFAGRYPWGGDDTASPFEWLESLKLMKSINPKMIVPGHGPIIHNLDEVVKLKTYLEKVITTSNKLISDGTEEEKSLEELNLIDYYEPQNPQLKELTLKRWFQVVKDQS